MDDSNLVIVMVAGGVGYIHTAPPSMHVVIRDYDAGKERHGCGDDDVEQDEDGDYYVITDEWAPVLEDN